MYCSLLHRPCLKKSRALTPTVWHVEYLVRNLLSHVVSCESVVCVMTHCWVHAVDAELLLCCQHIAWHAVRAVGGGTFSFKILLWHDWFTLKLAVRSIVLIPWKFFCFTIQHIPFALPFDLPPWSHAYSCTTKNFCCLLNTVTNWSADVDTKLAGEEVEIINHILISIDWSN